MRATSASLAFVVLVGLVLSLATVADAAAKKSSKSKGTRMEIAVQEEFGFVTDDANLRNLALNQGNALGATRVRVMFLMHMAHPCRGGEALRYINQVNQLVADAKRRGMKIHMTLTGVAAAWGVPRGCVGKQYRPTGANPSIKAVTKFINHYVKYYSDQGVHIFSLWNEPNLASFLCAKAVKTAADGNVDHSKCSASMAANAKLYAKIWKAGINVVNNLKKGGKIPKSTKVLFGEFAGADLKFLDEFVKHASVKASGFSYHPYQYCNDPRFKNKKFHGCKRQMKGMSWIPAVQAALKKHAHSGKLTIGKKGSKTPLPLHLTEFGYFQRCPASFGKEGMCGYGQPENIRSKWYPLALSFAQKHNVKSFVLYQLLASPPKTWNTALCDTGLHATPAYKAIWNYLKLKGYKTKAFV
jgi:hypothetical protein